MAYTTAKPVGTFTDIDGKPLEDGYVWFGQPNLDPVANPVSAYWDAAATQPVTQPVRTVGGYPMNGTTRGNVFVVGGYSVLVRNRNGFQVFTAPSLPFDDQFFLQSGTGAQPRSLTSKLRDIVSVKDFGAVGDGLADDTVAIQTALNTGYSLVFPQGTYRAANLTQSTQFQRLIADGDVKIIKNANGPIITSTAADVEFNGIGFRGDAATPTFTGDNVVSSGLNLRMINCGSRWAAGRAVKATGGHAQIIGTCDIYQTADATATGFDIELGVSGTATLYHQITNIVSSQSTGGILCIDTGAAMVTGSQFGKLTVNAGTSPAGSNGGHYAGNRISGNISVNLSNSVFAANQVAGASITFGVGTSGHMYDTSNATAVGTTITDNSSSSLVVDSKLVSPQSYTPTWTAATVNPTLGNGSISGSYTKTGKRVDVTIALSIGTTTTLGTGNWFFSLPAVPSTVFQWQGAGYCLVSGVAFFVLTGVALTDGTGRMIAVSNNAGNNVGPAIPAAWTSGSTLYLSMTYYANT